MANDADDYRIISSRAQLGRGPVSNDPIEPSEIRHQVDEILVGNQLDERYNYLDYHFERDGAYCRARKYLDSISSVAIFGPLASRTDPQPKESPAPRRDVLAYLKRRFDRIEELGNDGYVTIWSR